MIKTSKRIWTAALFAMLLNAQGWAAPVLTFNTGVDNSGAVLTNTTPVADTHYTLSASTGAAPPGSPIFAAGTGTINAAWAANDAANLAASRWIAPIVTGPPARNGFSGVGFGNANVTQFFTYRTTFDLTGYDVSTAVLSGFFAADNSAVAFLNGNSIGTAAGFGAASAFGTSSFFVAGINVLTFRVANAGSNSATNPTGLRVQYGVNADVPEINTASASLPLAVIAMTFLVLVDRRRSNAPAYGLALKD